jgi:prepilin-type processing-associated H-X9-DG protein
MLSISRFVLRAAAVGAALLSLQAQAKDFFQLVPLAPNTLASGAVDINNAGQIAGYRYLNDWVHASGATWHNGTEQLLGRDFGVAMAISGNGNIAGNWNVDEQDIGYRFAATYINGTSTILPPLVQPSSMVYSTAVGINNAGRVALSSSTGPEVYFYSQYADWHAAVYDHGKMTDLGTFGGHNSYAAAMNEAGTIVGMAQRADGVYNAFIYDDAGGMRNIGTLGGPSSQALAINDLGAVVGISNVSPGVNHAFLYQDGVMHDLGTAGFGSYMDINNLGQILLTVNLGGGKTANYLYVDGVRYDMADMVQGDEAYSALYLRGINDHGQIVGAATPVNGWEDAILLNPLAPVPEPATWGMLLAGFAVVGVARRRSRHA